MCQQNCCYIELCKDGKIIRWNLLAENILVSKANCIRDEVRKGNEKDPVVIHLSEELWNKIVLLRNIYLAAQIAQRLQRHLNLNPCCN